jgi:hypothetical protein
MTSRDFAFWLQGFFELTDSESISKEQTMVIKNHLNLVFKHDIDPSMGDKKHLDELNNIHNFLIPNRNNLPGDDGLIRC